MLRFLLPLLFIGFACESWSQGTVRGVVTDAATAETLPGANLVVKGTNARTVTDIDGRFTLKVEGSGPWTLVVSFVGYTTQEVVVADANKEVKVKLGDDKVLLKEADVVGTRITEKQKLAPLTVETMDVLAIREAASGDFYGSLGNLKGVDMTAASMGFKVINARGFNSTSPVRSLQLIDGVDNQSPGLNFSLGNFLGSSDL
ncbi:MAG TPA: carboxypeptidase-like regulatory domain-containing protein, partial [Flavobacteriales bacterium]|nr:carboxypeptidase-like regulatory domain-containing protein [Flavobacteriales bacterium]